MKRVVVTGMGVISCLGKDVRAVERALRESISGICAVQEYRDIGMKSHVAGAVEADDVIGSIPRKPLRFMGPGACYAYLAMEQAIADAGLSEEQIRNPRTGLIAGSGGASMLSQLQATDAMREKGIRRVGPYRVTQTMSSTVSACLSTAFGVQGVSYSISSACATSAHCIGNAMQLIQSGSQDVVFAGGGEEEHWTISCMFDAMGALSRQYNDRPERASRPYDVDRDGFVIAGGGGMLVLEELEHARKRGAPMYAELVGYGATCDGADMVAPNADGAARCMKLALAGGGGSIDYINAHGTSTPVGDISELRAIEMAFGSADLPLISSSKSLSGHSLGAAGVHEAIFSLLMLNADFVAASANIEQMDPQAAKFPVVVETRDMPLRRVMSNNFGFGGTNACLVFEKV